MSTTHRRYPVRVVEDVGVLRRAMAAEASTLPGLPDGDAELVATELATNILRHTAGGYVLTRPTGGGLELLAVDHGPGMPDEPGPPRAGGLEVGLAGVRRRASVFDTYSTRSGTVVLVRIRAAESGAGRWRWGGVTVPLGGAGASGDAWAVAAVESDVAALVVDGLGHGPEAAAAAGAAVEAFERQRAADNWLTDFPRRAHEAMRGTRGGVLGLCWIEPGESRLSFVGVGNITCRVLTGSDHHQVLGQHGTLGTSLRPPRPHPAIRTWPAGSTAVLTSDGIDTRWDPARWPGLLRHDPAVIAAVVHRDHARGNDDAAVLVVKDTGEATAGGDR